MYAAPFEYHRASSVQEAVGLLQRYGDDAKLLAGGHSLLPVLKLRLSTIGHLIDIRRIEGLSGIREAGDEIVIGAATSHDALQHSQLLQQKLPILAEAAAQIGDPAVRNLGTIGGSLAHADPAADLPAVILALGAELRVVGPDGSRTIAADDCFTGLFSTALRPGEILTEIRVPVPTARTGTAYEKHAHPASGFAVVGIAAVLTAGTGNTIAQARIAVTGVGTAATRAGKAETMLMGQTPTPDLLQLAASKVPDGIAARGDLYAPPEFRAQLARVHAERALLRAWQRMR
jgi:carbon-monoxide dehydrogenase medium subunit